MAWSTKSKQARGYGKQWDKVRAYALTRDNYLCQPCMKQGRLTPATAVDHIQNKASGGTDDMDNLQAICTDCHTRKTTWEATGRDYDTDIGKDGWPTDPKHPFNALGRGG